VFAAQSTGFYTLYAPWFVPVEFSSFEANVDGSSIKLIWSTATELNNKGFEIQMSEDNLNFKKIGFVPGYGTSAEKHGYSYDVAGLKEGKYYFRLVQIDFDGTVSYSKVNDVDLVLPKEFSLSQNYPNPFNPTTRIQYAIGSRQFVTLKIYDILGNEVAALINEEKEAGIYKVDFNPSSSIQNPVSGIYFFTLHAGDFVQTKKMLLLK